MRRRLLIALVVALTVVGATEGAVRFIEPGLSSTGAWPEGSMAPRFDRVDQAHRAGGVDVVFAGSSMVGEALDHPTFDRITGIRSLNASLPASTNIMLDPWLSNVVQPMLHPDVVVIGVASRDFNDNARGPDEALSTLLTAPGYQRIVGDDWLTALDRSASRVSALVRVRRQLREPSNVVTAVRQRPLDTSPTRCPRPAARERYVRSPIVDAYPQSVLYRYQAGGRQQRALIDAITSLHDRGVDVVLIELPAYEPDYVAVHPEGRGDIADYRRSLEAVVNATGVRVVDGTAFANKRYFRDAIHANCAGRVALTSALAESWDEIMRGTSSRVRLSSPPR